MKGTLGVMTQLLITVGIMISFFLGLIIPDKGKSDELKNPYMDHWQVTSWWRFMFGFPLILVVVQVSLLIFVFPYDTPKVLKQTQ